MAHSIAARDERDIESSATDVVLIYPYFYTHAPKAMLFHPQGIAQLTAVLRWDGVRENAGCAIRQRRNGSP